MDEHGCRSLPPRQAIEPEDQARANLYGLVSRLFYAPADSHLLAEICHTRPGGEGEEGAGGLLPAWRDLQEACRNAYPAVVQQEYDSLFVGVGKAEVTPYLSAYAEASAPDRYLVRLREQTRPWGLARRDERVRGGGPRFGCQRCHALADRERAAACRNSSGSLSASSIQARCRSVLRCKNAVSARFYKPVAAFAAAFLELEKAAFEMDDTA